MKSTYCMSVISMVAFSYGIKRSNQILPGLSERITFSYLKIQFFLVLEYLKIRHTKVIRPYFVQVLGDRKVLLKA